MTNISLVVIGATARRLGLRFLTVHASISWMAQPEALRCLMSTLI